MDRVRLEVRGYILEEFFQGEDESQLTNETSLVESGTIDSMAALKMFSWLEDEYDIEILPEDVLVTHLSTISRIAAFILKKQASGA
ncbi:MAG: acyl carrier protein [Myxococcales bacterium]|nr:acyl carrier protein [Myxococcales bacterium]MCB9752615.1 acyl carrier protein [Myxococcales bacterium]